jgi:hypothetical protein
MNRLHRTHKRLQFNLRASQLSLLPLKRRKRYEAELRTSWVQFYVLKYCHVWVDWRVAEELYDSVENIHTLDRSDWSALLDNY